MQLPARYNFKFRFDLLTIFLLQSQVVFDGIFGFVMLNFRL